MEKPFSKLSSIESPANLAVLARGKIDAAKKRASFARFISLAAIELVSIGTAAVSILYAFGSLKTSGMPQYLSLIFTDGTAVMAYSKELALSVLEALPAFSIAIALAAIVAFAWSTSRLIKISKLGIQYA